MWYSMKKKQFKEQRKMYNKIKFEYQPLEDKPTIADMQYRHMVMKEIEVEGKDQVDPLINRIKTINMNKQTAIEDLRELIRTACE